MTQYNNQTQTPKNVFQKPTFSAYAQPGTKDRAPGTAFHNKQLTTLVTAAWNISYTALWNAEEFSVVEIRNAKRFISNFIMSYADPYLGYVVFVQRVLLTREYLNNHPEKWVPIPSVWFHVENVNGFAGTEKWYHNMEQVRLALPLYRNHYKALAEAIVEILNAPTATNFHYWRSWFLERGKNVTINLYLATVANCCFSK
jgi:hypothetical protein